ncbi:MAG: AsnC family transcriptional regulator, partial [Rubrivivax sp.]|nr:AsnC family transcriptional regulator [Rubrivivax sp.]
MCLPSRRGFAPGSARCCEEWRLAHNLLRKQGRAVQLDSIDRAILEVLQQQGRISNQALAERVHL